MGEFKEDQFDAILSSLIEWITPHMNEIHELNHSQIFWGRIMRKHLKGCIYRMDPLSVKVYNHRLVFVNSQTFNIPTIKQEIVNAFWFLLRNFKMSESRNIKYLLTDSPNVFIGPRSEMISKYINGVDLGVLKMFKFGFESKSRKRLKRIAKLESSIFKKNILYNMPLIYVEFFKSNYKSIPVIKSEEKIFHFEHVNSYTNELLLAKYMENGSKLIGYQCGFGPGEMRNSPTSLDYLIIDKYRTYGWKIHPKDDPFIALRLVELKEKYDSFKGGGYGDIVIMYRPMNYLRKEAYYNNTKRFLEIINKTEYSRIVLRPKPISKRINNSAQLKYFDFLNKLNVTIDPGKSPVYELIANCRVMVHLDHPTTNFYECVFVNHPVVALLTNINPTDIIEKYYNFFLEKKVLHTTVDSLVDHLNSTNISEWWTGIIDEPIFKEYKSIFASDLIPDNL
ncbi:MAG: hypothetical protein WAT52_15530 [Chitinophagales bacterium]